MAVPFTTPIRFPRPFDVPATPIAGRIPAATATEEELPSFGPASHAINGIAAIGNVLDTPGSMIRDLLAGQNPLDNLLNPFSSENRVSGRDLLRQYDVIGSEDTWGNFFGGMATEIALDPFTWPARTLGLAGRAADAAGTAATAGRIANPSLGGLAMSAAINNPLTRAAGNAVMQSPVGNVVRGAQTAAKGLFHAPSGGHFTPGAQEISQRRFEKLPKAQATAREAFADVRDEFNEVYRVFEEAFGNTQQLAPGAQVQWNVNGVDQFAEPKVIREIQKGPDGREYAFLEGEATAVPLDQLTSLQAGDTSHLEKVFNDIAQLTGETGGNAAKAFKEILGRELSPELQERVKSVVQNMQEANKSAFQSFLDRGGRSAFMEDLEGFGHMPRYVDRKVAEEARILKNFGTQIDSAKGRSLPIRSIPEKIINRMLTDADARSIEHGASHILDKYGEYLGKDFKLPELADLAPDLISTDRITPYMERKLRELMGLSGREVSDRDLWGYSGRQIQDLKQMGPEGAQEALRILNETIKQNREIAKIIHADALHDWVRAHKAQELFTKAPLENFLKYHKAVQTANATMDAIHESFRAHILPENASGVSLAKAFEHVGMDPDAALEYFAAKDNMAPAFAANLQVDPEIVNAAASLQRVMENGGKNAWAKTITDAIDKFNSMFKSHVTVLFPSFASRNFMSGQFMNLTSGMVNTPADVKDYAKAFQQAFKMRLDDAAVREMEIHGVIGNRQGFEGVELVSRANAGPMPANPLDFRGAAADAEAFMAENPLLLDRLPLKGAANKAARGAKVLRKIDRTAIEVGSRVNQQVEWMNRVPMYLYLRGKGFDAAEAAAKVRELQIDYSRQNFTPFENEVVKRIIPFYSFTRKMAPTILGILKDNPAGPLGQTIRASRLSQDPEQPMPEYIAQQSAIPLGQLPDGSQRFLTGLGLAHEDTASYVGSPADVGMEILSRTTPLVKAPLEWMTGESFFQRGPMGGRDLIDMDPTLGRIVSNVSQILGGQPVETPSGTARPVVGRWFEQAVANSPASRLTTAIRQLTDPRKDVATKALNQLTGLKVADVSPAAMDRAISDELTSYARDYLGAQSMERIYFPKEAIEQAKKTDPEAAKRMQQVNRLSTILRKRREAREARQQATAN